LGLKQPVMIGPKLVLAGRAFRRMGRCHGIFVNFGERVVFVDQADFSLIDFEKLVDGRIQHRAAGTLKIGIFHDHDFGLGIPGLPRFRGGENRSPNGLLDALKRDEGTGQ